MNAERFGEAFGRRRTTALVQGASPDFDRAGFSQEPDAVFSVGDQQLGVREPLDALSDLGTPAGAEEAIQRSSATDERFTELVFRSGDHGPRAPRPVAFVRVCSAAVRARHAVKIAAGKDLATTVVAFPSSARRIGEAYPRNYGIPNHGMLQPATR